MSDYVSMVIILGVLVFIASLLKDTSPPHDPYRFV